MKTISNIESNISKKQKELLLSYKIIKERSTKSQSIQSQQNIPRSALRIVVDSDQLGSSLMSQAIQMEKPFNKTCDFVTHISIDSVNQWLKAQTDEKLFSGCVNMSGTEICSIKDQELNGEYYEAVTAPQLKWDSEHNGYVVVLDHVRRVKNRVDFIKFLGKSTDDISLKLGFIPVACNDGGICMDPTTSSGHLKLKGSNTFTKILGLVKFFEWPYLILGNAMVFMGSQYAKDELKGNSLQIPEIKIVEIQSSEKMISLCSQINRAQK